MSSTRKLLDESDEYCNYQLLCQTYNNSQNNTNNVSSASPEVSAITNLIVCPQSAQVLSQPTQTKSLLKPVGRNTNQVAITTKSRGRPPLSTPEKLRRAAERKAFKETQKDRIRSIAENDK